MLLERKLNLKVLLEKKSFFLFGPRATGKSSLVNVQLGERALVFDLLRSDIYLRLSANPDELETLIPHSMPFDCVVIDEIQKIPLLLDEVHRLIEKRKIRFLLTGSSARKLKRGSANLLAGRAWTAELFPLTCKEIHDFQLERFLRFGGLPAVYLSNEPKEELKAYAKNYLYEEIQAEGLVRKLPAFSRFLLVAAHSNGLLLNFAKIGSDCSVPPSTVVEYFQILQDTLLGCMLEPWTKSKKRKAISTAKFYFFDTGVTHALSLTENLDRNSDLYGRSFEQWIGMELRAYLSYLRKDFPLGFWRSANRQEVDFTLGDRIAIEVKASKKVSQRDTTGLQALKQERVFKRYIIVSQDPISAKQDGVERTHWKVFMEQLWGGEII